MKTLLTLMLAVSLIAPSARAARRRAVATPPAGDLTITFVPMAGESLLGDTLDVGSVAHRGYERRDVTKVTRTVGIRVTRTNGAKGVAALRAWVEAPDARVVLRVDGVVLSSVPRLVDSQAPLGAVIVHRIEIEVPVTAAEGAVLSSIRWEATTGD